MKLEDALHIWGLWLVTDGYVTSAELTQMIESGESVISGEVTKKAGSIALVDNTVPEYLDRAIDENCSLLQRDILMIEYGGGLNSEKWCPEEAAKYLGINRQSYSDRLCRAKKKLRLDTFFY